MILGAHGLALRERGMALRAHGLPPSVRNHCQQRLVALFQNNLCSMRGNPCALRSNPFAGPMDVELTATSLRDLIAGLAPKVQESLSIPGSKV